MATGPGQDEGPAEDAPKRGLLGRLGHGLVAGAADDDPSAIGTYASAGAKLGLSFLWAAPVTLPMMFTVVYLSAKIGQVSGRGLFQLIAERYSRRVLYPTLVCVLIGNTVEAGADLGGMAAAIDLVAPGLPIPWITVPVAAAVLALQLFGTYAMIRDTFKWLALALLAYVGAAFLAKPDLWAALRGTFVPTIQLTPEFLSLLVAVIGTTLSAYLYTWQSNEVVEEEIAEGRTTVEQRQGATHAELRKTRRDVLIGMIFSNVIMYFILMATGATLHAAGQTEIETAAQAAAALEPLAGPAASFLFAAGIIGVGFLAVPVMTTGAAYDLAQAFGWRHSLHARPREAPAFYAAIVGFTILAVGLNFLGFNPMKALVWSGIVQGFSTPFLLILILLLTNDRRVMGSKVNSRIVNVMGIVTVTAMLAASLGLIAMWTLGS